MGWQWHQLECMQIICTSLQTGNHASTSPLNFLQTRCSSNTQETQTQKRWTRILEFDFCDFWQFFEIFKRRRTVPLRPIWTIMVAAKLDQSKVLVTKFRQNQLTVNGRSVGKRHTHRQTDRQTRLKIMALQVCNLANRILQLVFSKPLSRYAWI